MAACRLMLLCALLVLALSHARAARVYLLDDGVEDQAGFSDAVPASISAVSSRDRVPDGSASAMTPVHKAQQIYTSGRSLENNATADGLNSVSRPWTAQNSEAVQRNSKPHRPTEHINISLGSYGTVALRNSSQEANNEKSLRNKYTDKVVSSSQDDQNERYSDISESLQVENISHDVYTLAEHKTLNGSTVSAGGVSHENEMKHVAARDNTKEGTRPEARSFRYRPHFNPNDDDSVARETELIYSGGDDVPFGQEAQLHVSAQDGGLFVFPGNYKTEAEPIIPSSGTLRVLHRPHMQPRPSRGPTHTDPSSYYGLSSGGPYKSSGSSYILVPKATDSFGLESASYGSIASVPHRPPSLIYDSPPRELLSASHGSPFRKPASAPYSSPSRKPSGISYASPPRKPPIVSYESPPYKQFSPSYNSPPVDLYDSSSTLHYSFGPAPHKIQVSRPPYNAQAGDSYGSHTLTHSSFPYGSKPPSSPSHGPPRHSHSSPMKKSPSLSYNLQSSELYESLTSPYSSSSHASRPPTLGDSPSHKSHRPSHGPPQKSPAPPQFSELYKSPTSHYTSSRDTYSSTHASHKPPQKSPRPSHKSQPSQQNESQTSLYSLSTHDPKSPSILQSSLSNAQYGPSYSSPSKKSHRPSHDSESTDSVESPSSSHSSPPHGSWSPSISEISPSHRLPKPLHGSTSIDSHRSHTPNHDSPSSVVTSTSYGLPSNLIPQAPSETFQESLGSSEGGSGGSTHTFVKTDHHGNLKWGVRHSVGNQNAGSHL